VVVPVWILIYSGVRSPQVSIRTKINSKSTLNETWWPGRKLLQIEPRINPKDPHVV